MSTPTIVSGRSCAACTLCCKLPSVGQLNKPQQSWCSHCSIGVGCTIYESRPFECADFHCSWLLDEALGEEWRPADCGMVVNYDDLADRVVVHVDGTDSAAWRREPYYSQIKRWARGAAERGGQLIVWQGLDAVAVLPDRDKMLGRLGPDQLIVTSNTQTPHGIERDVILLERGDPRLKGGVLAEGCV